MLTQVKFILNKMSLNDTSNIGKKYKLLVLKSWYKLFGKLLFLDSFRNTRNENENIFIGI